MRSRWLIVLSFALVLLVAGLAEAHGPVYGNRPWYGHHPRTTVRFGFNFVAPLYYYPTPSWYYSPVYVPPPVYVPQCTTYTTPGYYRQVPWYTDSNGFTTFRQEWVPPTTAQTCR